MRNLYEKNPNGPIIWKQTSLAILFIAYRQYIGCKKWVNKNSLVRMLIGPKLVTVTDARKDAYIIDNKK